MMVGITPGRMLLLYVGTYFLLATPLVKWLWGVVPALFPRLVREGSVAENISWFTAFKLALILGILAMVIK